MADEHSGGERPLDQLEAWKRLVETGEASPRDTYNRVSKIALLLCYDLIDKLRHWEKETLECDDEEVVRRVEHMTTFMDRLREAYLRFGEAEGAEDNVDA